MPNPEDTPQPQTPTAPTTPSATPTPAGATPPEQLPLSAEDEGFAEEFAKLAAEEAAAEGEGDPPAPADPEVPGEPAPALTPGEPAAPVEPAAAVPAAPTADEGPVAFTREENAAFQRAEIKAMKTGISKYEAQYEQEFGPLQTPEEVDKELKALQAEEVVSTDLKEVNIAVDRKIERALGDFAETTQQQFDQHARETKLANHDLFINSHHPDFPLIQEAENGGDVMEWIQSLNKRDGDQMEAIFRGGTAGQVVGMLNFYKEARGIKSYQEILDKTSSGGANPAETPAPAPGNTEQLVAAEAVPSRPTTSPLTLGENLPPEDEFGAAFKHFAGQKQ